MLHSCQLNDRTIEIDGDENVIFEEDDEEDEGYLLPDKVLAKHNSCNWKKIVKFY